MASKLLLTTFAILGATLAQTPLGFTPSTGTSLHVSFDGKDVLPAGKFFPVDGTLLSLPESF
jgi:hypothetical protein